MDMQYSHTKLELDEAINIQAYRYLPYYADKLAEIENIEKAVDVYEKYIKIQIGSCDAWIALAKLCQRVGQSDKDFSILEQLSQDYPSNTRVQALLDRVK